MPFSPNTVTLDFTWEIVNLLVSGNNMIQAGSDMIRIFVVGENLSGIDVGEIDYSIAGARFDDLSNEEKKKCLWMLKECADWIERNYELEK